MNSEVKKVAQGKTSLRPMLAYLTEVQHRQLAALAKALGVSKAQLIRDGVNLLLRQAASQGRDPLLDLLGQAGPVGRSDIAAHHDTYQADLFQAARNG